MSKALKISWFLLVCAFASFSLSQPLLGEPSGGIGATIIVTFLTSPAGYLIAVGGSYFFAMLREYHLISENFRYIDLIIFPFMIGGGYCQWFILLPALVRRLKNSKIF